MLFSAILLLLLAALFSPNSSALSISQPNTLNQFNVSALGLMQTGNLSLLSPKVTNLGGGYSCIPSSKYVPWTKRPTLRDCGAAIRNLPSSGDIAVFKRKNMLNPLYNLPKIREVGSCKVTVNLTEYAQSAWSSWTEIGLAAMQGDLACMKGSNTGGNTTCGEQDKVLIVQEWIKDSDPDDFYLGDGPELTNLEAYNALTGAGTERGVVMN